MVTLPTFRLRVIPPLLEERLLQNFPLLELASLLLLESPQATAAERMNAVAKTAQKPLLALLKVMLVSFRCAPISFLRSFVPSFPSSLSPSPNTTSPF